MKKANRRGAALLAIVWLATATGGGCAVRSSSIEIEQTGALARAVVTATERTFVFDGDWRVGDCTMLNGAVLRAFPNGEWNMDADVRSSDTNDRWDCRFAFLNENQAQVYQSSERRRVMPNRNTTYHWRINASAQTSLQQQYGTLTWGHMRCSC
jgi:hypothetical protein